MYRGSFATGTGKAVVTPDPPAESESEDEGYDRIDHRALALLAHRNQAPVSASGTVAAAKRINGQSGKEPGEKADAVVRAFKGL